MSIIFVFIDGIGLINATTHNPFGLTPQPYISQLIGGPLLIDQVGLYPQARLSAIDATLDWPGLPQSGTGQTSLFVGINAAHAVQRHQSHFPPTDLHDVLRTQNMLTQAKPYGTSAFANAFDAGFWQAIETRKLRRSASVIAGEGAGVRFRDVTDLAQGQALSWDITSQVMHQRHPDLITPIDAFTAGRNLALLAQTHVITLYETFLTDLVGHGRTDITTADVVTRIDGLIGGIVAHLRPCDTLVMSSDHGNFEAPHEKGHTTNPVPLLVVGADCDTLHNINSISMVVPALVARYPYHREAGQ
jgi:hypothetical protein